MSGMLSEFSRSAQPSQAEMSSRVAAGMLTSFCYALLALLIWWTSTKDLTVPARTGIVTTIIGDVPNKKSVERVPPLPVDLIRPRAEQPAPPVFTTASGAPSQAPAPLPASAATSSPLSGGTSGNGPMGQSASGNGTGGNGATSAGCLDPIWIAAVTERVRQFYFYPEAALAVRTTGVATVHFMVRRNGQIDRLQIRNSSGDSGLDKAAIAIMQKAQPLPPIPERMQVPQVEGDIPINFGVRSFSGKANIGNC